MDTGVEYSAFQNVLHLLRFRERNTTPQTQRIAMPASEAILPTLFSVFLNDQKYRMRYETTLVSIYVFFLGIYEITEVLIFKTSFNAAGKL